MAKMAAKEALQVLKDSIFKMECVWTSLAYEQIPEVEGKFFGLQRAGELRAAIKLMRGVSHFIEVRERAWQRKKDRKGEKEST
jgi:hypothetical protein